MAAPSKTERTLRRRLASSVRRLRAHLKLSQVATSDRAGLDLRHLQKVEAGEANATLQTIAKLADALGVDAADLIGPEPERRR